MADRAAGALAVTPIETGLISRLTSGLRYALTGRAPDGWFGPLDPPTPAAPETEGRMFDIVPGYNLNTAPRTGEPISFRHLRALADSHDVLRAMPRVRSRSPFARRWHTPCAQGRSLQRVQTDPAVDRPRG